MTKDDVRDAFATTFGSIPVIVENPGRVVFIHEGEDEIREEVAESFRRQFIPMGVTFNVLSGLKLVQQHDFMTRNLLEVTESLNKARARAGRSKILLMIALATIAILIWK